MYDEFDEWDECHGSCDRCGCNLYEGDGEFLCDQCEWWSELYAEQMFEEKNTAQKVDPAEAHEDEA